MLIMTRDQGEQLISPLAKNFAELTLAAWQDWITSPFAPQLQKKTVRANLVWNQIIARGKTHFHGHPTVRVDKMREWDGFVIDSRVFVRPKYAQDGLHARNYPTPSALDYHDQDLDLFRGISRLDLIYTLDPLETAIERIAVVQRHKKAVAWTIDLMGNSDTGQEFITFTPSAPSGSPADRIIKPKRHGENNAVQPRKRSGGEDV